MNDGWILLHRRIIDSDFWKYKPFSKGQAWIDLLLLANHGERTIYIRGNKVDIKRGQFIHAEKTLARRWGWSNHTVRAFVKNLVRKQKLHRRISRICSINTVVNYDKYQNPAPQRAPQRAPEQIMIKRSVRVRRGKRASLKPISNMF